MWLSASKATWPTEAAGAPVITLGFSTLEGMSRRCSSHYYLCKVFLISIPLPWFPVDGELITFIDFGPNHVNFGANRWKWLCRFWALGSSLLCHGTAYFFLSAWNWSSLEPDPEPGGQPLSAESRELSPDQPQHWLRRMKWNVCCKSLKYFWVCFLELSQ